MGQESMSRGHRIAAGLCLGWVVSCLRFCSRMNQKWPCLKSQKSTTGCGSGQARARSRLVGRGIESDRHGGREWDQFWQGSSRAPRME